MQRFPTAPPNPGPVKDAPFVPVLVRLITPSPAVRFEAYEIRKLPPTVIEAVAVFPVTRPDETTPVVFTCSPGAMPVTFTVTVQDALDPSVPLESETNAGGPEEAIATPPQLLAKPLGLAMPSPAGSGSENATAAMPIALGLLIVSVS